jgi:hypothetical protein
MGIKREHIVVWEGNGIEYVYPRKLLERRFGQFSDFTINGDIVIVNGHSVTKQELNNYVVNNLRGEEELPQELMEKLLTPLEAWLF